MLAEAVLHAHANRRPTLKNMVEAWNKILHKEVEHTPSMEIDAAAAFLASLEEHKLTSLAEAGKKPPIEILPPGMPSLSAPFSVQRKHVLATQSSLQQPNKPLALEAPPTATPVLVSTPPAAEASDPTLNDKSLIPSSGSSSVLVSSKESAPATTDAVTPQVPSKVPDTKEKPQLPNTKEKPQENDVTSTLPMSDSFF